MSYFQQDKIMVIAEAGKNFIITEKPTTEQCLNEAKNLARLAKGAGADAVKFQTHVFEDEQHKRDPSRHEWIKLNESLTPYEEFWKPLKEYCDSIGILFMTTPMSFLAAKKIADLVTVWKVGSADVVDRSLLGFLCDTGKPVITSTGMSTSSEIEIAIEILKMHKADFAVLHCTSLYPCPVNRLNLERIRQMDIELNPRGNGIIVGLSDHSTSLTVPVLAIELGARIIEKHFTIGKDSHGSDHAISLDFKEFSEMVRNIRVAEERLFAYGDGVKRVYPEEEAKRRIFRYGV